MCKRFLYLILFVFALHPFAKAQQEKILKFQWKAGRFYNWSAPRINESTPVRPLSLIKYTLPATAIFCRMEDVLHRHFNIWMKVRMGDDDRYSN